MRIVICHNFYQQAGGEDQIFADEAELLASRGHHVVKFAKRNDDVNESQPWALAAGTIWNCRAARELEQLVRDHRAEIVHFHNTLPLISPSAYYAARRAGAAVVQSLHNFRLVCPKASLFRDGKLCEACLGKRIPWPAVQHGCYRDSRSATAAIVTMLTLHRTWGTYRHAVDAYIVALSQFARDKLIAGGLPAEKMHLKPNFMLEDPGAGHGQGGYALFLGRLAPEKGIETLLAAWERHEPGIPLVICGSGPLSPLVEQAAARCDNITWIQNPSRKELLERLGDASVLVVPSEWYEGFPKTIVEAFSKGTPVVASRLGAMVELVRDGKTGFCFTPGDATDLAATVRRILSDPERLDRMRVTTRQQFETQCTASTNYVRLLEIYNHALRVRHGATAPAALSNFSLEAGNYINGATR